MSGRGHTPFGLPVFSLVLRGATHYTCTLPTHQARPLRTSVVLGLLSSLLVVWQSAIAAVYRFIGVWQQGIAKDHRERTVFVIYFEVYTSIYFGLGSTLYSMIDPVQNFKKVDGGKYVLLHPDTGVQPGFWFYCWSVEHDGQGEEGLAVSRLPLDGNGVSLP